MPSSVLRGRGNRPSDTITSVSTQTVSTETVFTYGAPPLKFGIGASNELAHDLSTLGSSRPLVLTDPDFAATGEPSRIVEQLRQAGLDPVLFDQVRVEPTDESLVAAIAFARDQPGSFDAFVAVGGGSTIDTAKAVNLLTTNPGELNDYLNPPIGAGRAPEHPLKPLVAVPTTAGTGSESTTVCVLDVLSLQVKTGISHPALRPALAVIDPELTMSMPPLVTACSGLDILCHALESYTARPFDSYPAKRAEQRVPYCGANPIADMWAEKSLQLLGQSLRTAVHDGSNRHARHEMALAATFAGMGFGNAGVHIPHACGYPIAGRVRSFTPTDYPDDHPMVPHGMSVALTAPAAFRFTFSAAPERHLRAAELLDPGHDSHRVANEDTLGDVVASLLSDIGMPDGLSGVGYGAPDVPMLVEGAMKQQRLLAVSPREVTAEALTDIFTESL